LVSEASSPAISGELRRDPVMVVWWATTVECVSALARRERDELLDAAGMAVAIERLDATAAAWREVLPTSHVRRTAVRLLRIHPLRAADALQLAAAVIASDGDQRSLPFVTLDQRLALAAQREGFAVIEPATA
jgi:predicted nucleic acid-binding protein